jgi:molybdopterin molybdotransferase
MALLPVDEARRRILDGVRPLPTEWCNLGDALGRTTATLVKANRDSPPFDASAMDGYALRSADIREVPQELHVVGTSAAGRRFRGRIKAGETVRIFTGAPLPDGADCVVIQENTEALSGSVKVLSRLAAGQNIRNQALDFKRGEPLIPEGTRLSPRDIGLAAAMNCAQLKVRRRPVIAVLATGDELVKPGEKPRSDQIVSSNSNALLALAASLGGEPVNAGLVRDDLKATTAAIRKLQRADIILTSGGASVGDHDYVQAALQQAGFLIDFWKIAMRPGKPFMYGRKGKIHALGLPGNPVSALVCAELFLKPLVAALLGQPVLPQLRMALLGSPLPANDLRQDHLRARISHTVDGRIIATPFSKQDSSMMRTFREADCLIVRKPNARAAKTGEIVEVLDLRS